MRNRGLPLEWSDKTILRMKNAIFHDYYNRIRNIALSRYEWRDLPEDMNERYIEWLLFYNGTCVFFYDEILEKYLSLQCTTTGEMDFYNLPKKVTAYSTNVNYTYKELDMKNCALCFNNLSWLPDEPTAYLFAQKLTSIEMNILSNVELQKFALIVKTPEKKKLTYKNLMQKFFGYQPFIMTSEGTPIDNIEILNQNIPYIADKLQIQKINTWKEMLSAFGIVTPASEKTERLVSNEVTAGLGYSEMAQNVGLVSRRQAVEHFNELFGTNVSVDFRSNLYADILGENTQGYTDNTYQDNTEDDTFSTQRTARQSKGVSSSE